MSERQYRFVLALITALVTLATMTWALLTPPFRAPDEPQHANSVIRLMYGGGWPAPNEAEMAPAMRTAQSEAALTSDLPGSIADRYDREFEQIEPPPDTARSRVHEDNALANPPVDHELVDQMTQHPPGYYAATAAALDLLEAEEERWDIQLLAMRLVSVALTIPLPLLLAGAVRTLTRSTWVAAAAATGPLFVPQLLHIQGSVTNDALLTVLGALATLLLIRIMGGDTRFRVAILLGVTLGVGLLTKAFMAFLVPAGALAYITARGMRGVWQRASRALVVVLVAIAVGGWWWVRNLILFGTLQPSAGIVPDSGTPERASVGEYLQIAVGQLSQSFWGKFAWLEIPLPGWFVAVASLILIVFVLLGVLATRRRREALLLGGMVALVALAVLTRGYQNHLETGTFPGLQGRYFYVAMAAIVAVAALGVQRVVSPGAAWPLPAAVVGGLAVSTAGLVVAFRGYYWSGAGVWDAAERWVAWSPATQWQCAAVLALTVLTALAVLAATATLAIRARGPRA